MDERSSRIFVGLCLLVLVWIGVYWMWEPERDDPPRITFPGAVEEPEDSGAVIDREPEPEPEPVVIENPLRAPIERQPVIPPEIITDLDAGRHATRVIPPEFTTHTVREYETMGSIAKSLWGSSSRWDVISRANPSVDPDRLRVGMVLRIPVDPDNVQGKVVRDDREPGAVPEPTAKVVEYFVQSGDSLSRIAQRFYGSSRYADFIYDYNRDTLRSKDDLKIGQLLKLPPLDETEQPGG
ncbi:MAG: LysM peptidoglycan-binding domain-containing protein [Phycisphaerales bacterium]|nr:LysM peptidoglycan-binding domain-containing protein [Phycisphaerales bacterium]